MKSYRYFNGKYFVIEDPLGKNENLFTLIKRGWAEHRKPLDGSRFLDVGSIQVYIANHENIPLNKSNDNFPFDFLVVIYAVSTYNQQTVSAGVRVWFEDLPSYIMFMKEIRNGNFIN